VRVSGTRSLPDMPWRASEKSLQNGLLQRALPSQLPRAKHVDRGDGDGANREVLDVQEVALEPCKRLDSVEGHRDCKSHRVKQKQNPQKRASHVHLTFATHDVLSLTLKYFFTHYLQAAEHAYDGILIID